MCFVRVKQPAVEFSENWEAKVNKFWSRPSSVAADPKITRHWFATLAGNNMSFFLLF